MSSMWPPATDVYIDGDMNDGIRCLASYLPPVLLPVRALFPRIYHAQLRSIVATGHEGDGWRERE